jgi:hypothetical protein
MVRSRLAGWLAAAAVVALLVVYVAHLRSEIARLEGTIAQGARSAPGAAVRQGDTGAAAAAANGRTLTAAQREAMIEKLGGRGTSSATPVWFATVSQNAEAAAFQRALASVFEEAGWQVRDSAPVHFPMKPGIFVFAADEEPPPYVARATDALEAGGVSITVAGNGYRRFSEERKAADPDWVGFEMTPDQTYVIVVGRMPEEPPAF